MDDVTATASLFLLHQHFSGIPRRTGARRSSSKASIAARNAVRTKGRKLHAVFLVRLIAKLVSGSGGHCLLPSYGCRWPIHLQQKARNALHPDIRPRALSPAILEEAAPDNPRIRVCADGAASNAATDYLRTLASDPRSGGQRRPYRLVDASRILEVELERLAIDAQTASKSSSNRIATCSWRLSCHFWRDRRCRLPPRARGRYAPASAMVFALPSLSPRRWGVPLVVHPRGSC